MNAVIVTIGDELLIGQVIDTNSAWIAKELNKVGINVKRRIAVGDDAREIVNCLEEQGDADVVLITGGLGPTSDDITKITLCNYFGGKLVVNEEALQNVKYLFEQVYKRPLLQRNLLQAEVPDVCQVIQNKKGSAPGMVFRKGQTTFISMPGVPHEMMDMMEREVIPLLRQLTSTSPVSHRTLMTFGIGESFLAEKLSVFESKLPPSVRLAYLPNFGLLRLRLTSAAINSEEILNQLSAELKQNILDHLISEKDETMQQLVGELLLQKGKTVSTAESCTGGYISHLFTSIPGSSRYFKGGVVSYANSVKHQVLGVRNETIEKYGAVSEEVVKEMLIRVVEFLKTDYGIAVSGIMGPTGGTEEKPVGTVWIAVGSSEAYITRKFQLRYDRRLNIEITAQQALNLLREFIAAS